MTSTVFLLHGFAGDPSNHWFPWLSDALREEGHEVVAPRLPTPEGQTLPAWEAVMEDYLPLPPDAILVGHSLGAPFALRLLEKAAVPVKAAFLVAGFAERLGIERFDTANATFIDPPFSWERIREHCGRFVLYASDNDPYVPLAIIERLGAHLSVPVRVLPGRGHFNARAGMTSFPELLAAIRGLSAAGKHL